METEPPRDRPAELRRVLERALRDAERLFAAAPPVAAVTIETGLPGVTGVWFDVTIRRRLYRAAAGAPTMLFWVGVDRWTEQAAGAPEVEVVWLLNEEPYASAAAAFWDAMREIEARAGGAGAGLGRRRPRSPWRRPVGAPPPDGRPGRLTPGVA